MVRRIRLATGLVLFAFVTTHLLNHMLGVVSLEAMEEGRRLFLLLWRNAAGTALLYLSLIVHVLLAAYALYARRSLRMTGAEALQLVLGFAIPMLLAVHVAGTRGASQIFGTDDSYAYVLLAQWRFSDTAVYWQTLGLYAAWIHGCIGLYFWLRLKPRLRTWMPAGYAVAVLVPVVAWLGYYAGGKEVLWLAQNREWLLAALRAIQPPNAAEAGALGDTAFVVRSFVGALIAAALAARFARTLVERRRGMIRIRYPGGRIARVPSGVSILEASRLVAIPHASVCGGRGRCSTCRVRIVDGAENLPEASAEETRVLERVGAPPGVRLACQSAPLGDISVMPLLPPNASLREVHRAGAGNAGQERDIAVLFADLRSFTEFSEKKLPYDVVFVLNRYFAQMGAAVEDAGGHLDKFIGDGVMALFGTRSDIATGARQALAAAGGMAHRLAELNEQLGGELDAPLRIGIGIHVGPAIIGEMGYGTATGLTAVGDTVNTASRLEAMTKEFSAQLVFSEDVAVHAGLATGDLEVHETRVRGRAEPVKIYVMKDAAGLAG